MSEGNQTKLYPILAFLSMFLLIYPTIRLGLDVTDTGFHLTNQMLANHLGIEFIKIMPFWWMTDMIGGLWLRAIDSLWGARLAGVLIYSSIAMLSVLLVQRVYKPHWIICLAIVASGMFSYSSCMINYETIPLLLYVLFSLFFLQIHYTPERKLYACLCGVLLAILPFTRMPMVLTFFLPVLTISIAAYYKQAKRILSSYLAMYIVSLLTLLSIAFYLWTQGLLFEYLFYKSPSSVHVVDKLIVLYAKQVLGRIPFLTLLFGVPLLLYWMSKRKLLSLYSFGALLLFTYGLSLLHTNLLLPFRSDEKLYMLLFFILSLLGVVSIYLQRKTISLQEVLLFFLGIMMPLLFVAGSASGFPRTQIGMWLLGAIVANLLMRNIPHLSLPKAGPPLYLINSLFLLCLGCYGVKIVYFNTPRDASHAELICRLESARLAGIYTTSPRKESFDALVAEVVKNSHPLDPILAYHAIPLLYYATHTVPVGNHSWLTVLPSEVLKKIVEGFSENAPPSLIVRSKTHTDRPDWGLKSIQVTITDDYLEELENIEIIDQAIQAKWDLSLVWSNADFDLYKPTAKSSVELH